VYSSSHRGKPSSTRARLTRCIFEVDPLRCGKCGAELRIIAFVTDFRQTNKTPEHIGERPMRHKTYFQPTD